MNNIYEYVNNIVFSFQAMCGFLAVGGAGLSVWWHKQIIQIGRFHRSWFPLALFLSMFCSGTSIALGKWGFLSLPLVVLAYSYLYFSNKIRGWEIKYFLYFILSLIILSVIFFLILGTVMFKLAVDH